LFQIVGVPRVELGLTGPKPVVPPSYATPSSVVVATYDGQSPLRSRRRLLVSPRQESNPHQLLRRELLYPLSYEGDNKMPNYFYFTLKLLAGKEKSKPFYLLRKLW